MVCAARRAEKLDESVAEMQAQGWAAGALPLDMADLATLESALADPYDIIVSDACGPWFRPLDFSVMPSCK